MHGSTWFGELVCADPLSKYQLLITLPRLIVDYVSQCDHCSTASLVHEIELYNRWHYVKEKEILFIRTETSW